MLDMYLDESVSTSANSLVVGGFVADVDKWADFSVKRKGILDQYGLPYFHTTTFRSKRASLYSHLSQTERSKMLDLLIGVICDRLLFNIASVVQPTVYESLTTPRFRSDYGSAYGFAAMGCLLVLQQLSLDNPQRADCKPPQEFGIFLEDGHKNSGQVLELLRDHKRQADPIIPNPDDWLVETEVDRLRQVGIRVRTYGLGAKRTMVPLQAADLLAYCVLGNATRREPFCNAVLKRIDGAGVPGYSTLWREKSIKHLIASVTKNEMQRGWNRWNTYETKKALRKQGFDVVEVEGALSIKQGTATPEEYTKLMVGIKLSELVKAT